MEYAACYAAEVGPLWNEGRVTILTPTTRAVMKVVEILGVSPGPHPLSLQALRRNSERFLTTALRVRVWVPWDANKRSVEHCSGTGRTPSVNEQALLLERSYVLKRRGSPSSSQLSCAARTTHAPATRPGAFRCERRPTPPASLQ